MEIIQSCCQDLCSESESTHRQSPFYLCCLRNKMWQLGTFSTPWKLGTLKHHRWAISPHMARFLPLPLIQLAANCYFRIPSMICKMPLYCHSSRGDDFSFSTQINLIKTGIQISEVLFTFFNRDHVKEWLHCDSSVFRGSACEGHLAFRT